MTWFEFKWISWIRQRRVQCVFAEDKSGAILNWWRHNRNGSVVNTCVRTSISIWSSSIFSRSARYRWFDSFDCIVPVWRSILQWIFGIFTAIVDLRDQSHSISMHNSMPMYRHVTINLITYTWNRCHFECWLYRTVNQCNRTWFTPDTVPA